MEVTEPVQSRDPNLDPGVWRCLVCNKPSNYIHVLPCQHKFCAECLRMWAMIYVDVYHGVGKEFPCQVCWKQFAVPIQGLEAFEQDYKVKALERSLEHLTMDGQETDHELQPDSSPSSEQCFDRSQYGSTFPSMLSHMAPPTFYENEAAGSIKPSVPDYCVRSRHMYLHMI
ncbi:hypothetical protein LSH36_721g02015 [Paralvinella palmiformis]|uniref:RING-type domain-containing protein n=1 Tax=Paralvinella palmiformis TaxID=53620 RepID=A0AAD9J2H6_9ANNE|nr:hypothetical protein LSH36_721g02015 [Paralvinella palmiformis]